MTPPAAPTPGPAAGDPLRLRARPPTVMRLSRKVIIGLAGVSAVAILGAVGFAMTAQRNARAAPELYQTGGPPPEQLQALAKDYSAVPQLGPPLPGDLGRPMRAADVAAPPMGADPVSSSGPPADPARAVGEAREAARRSAIFAAQTRTGAIGTRIDANPDLPAGGQTADPPSSILNAPADRRTTSPDRLQAPPSPDVVQAGTIIPAALITAIRSDLPGQVTAQVTENVYDSPTGRRLLIPQGTRLIGTYDSRTSFGQDRVLLAWTRLILPGGRSLVLENLPAADAQGGAGLTDKVDRHWRGLFAAAALSTLLSFGAEAGQDDESELVEALRRGGARSFNQAGQQVVTRGLSVTPTLIIRAGAPLRVMVTRDLVLEPLE